MIYADRRCLDHDPAPHPESPARLRAILDTLDERGLPTESAPDAARHTLAAVHDSSYLDDLQAFCEAGGGRWDADTRAVPATFAVARRSAGLAVAAVERAVTEGDPAFALGRPPGHHATRDDAMGFCFCNNVAVAVERALLDDEVDRVAVLDWDVHHGNGTAAHFRDRGDVCYASVHARGLFPGTGDAEETGTGDGRGTTVHLPVPPTAGDAEFLSCYDSVVAPVFRRFDPDLVVVSAGFDAHRRDPLSRATMTTDGYRSLAARLRETTTAVAAAGPTVVLEGGYDPSALAESVLATRDAVVDGVCPAIQPQESPPETVASLVADQRERFDL